MILPSIFLAMLTLPMTQHVVSYNDTPVVTPAPAMTQPPAVTPAPAMTQPPASTPLPEAVPTVESVPVAPASAPAMSSGS